MRLDRPTRAWDRERALDVEIQRPLLGITYKF